MGDAALISAGIAAGAAVAVTLGHILGEQRRHRDAEAEIRRQLASYQAVLHALAEDYDPPDEPDDPEPRRGKLPAGWAVIEGGGLGGVAVVALAWLHRSWRGIVGTAAAAGGAAALVALAMLWHGAPACGPFSAGRPPSPVPTVGTAYVTPSTPPVTGPVHTPRRTGVPPLPVLPIRSRRSIPGPVPTGPVPPTPEPHASPSPRPTPTRTPPPSATPSAGCPLDLTLKLVVGVYVCV